MPMIGALLLCLWPATPIWAATSTPAAVAADEPVKRQQIEGETAGGDSGETSPTKWSLLTSGGSFRVEIESDPDPIPLNEIFSLRFRVTESPDSSLPATGAVITADAWMPDHQHGTNLKPRITSQGDGTAIGNGFLWHMEGKWELKIGVAVAGKMEWGTLLFELEP